MGLVSWMVKRSLDRNPHFWSWRTSQCHFNAVRKGIVEIIDQAVGDRSATGQGTVSAYLDIVPWRGGFSAMKANRRTPVETGEARRSSFLNLLAQTIPTPPAY